MTKYTKDAIKEVLTKGEATVTFTKVDGTVRKMKASLTESVLADFPVKNDDSSNEEVLAVIDTEANAWKSFRIDSVTNIEQ